MVTLRAQEILTACGLPHLIPVLDRALERQAFTERQQVNIALKLHEVETESRFPEHATVN